MSFLARDASAEGRDFSHARALFAAVSVAADESSDVDRIIEIVRERHGDELADYLEWIVEERADLPHVGMTPDQQLEHAKESLAALRILNVRREIALAGQAGQIATVGARLAWLRDAERSHPRAALTAQAALTREGLGDAPQRVSIAQLRERRAERMRRGMLA